MQPASVFLMIDPLQTGTGGRCSGFLGRILLGNRMMVGGQSINELVQGRQT